MEGRPTPEGNHLLDHAQAERKTKVKPDGVADDLGRKAVAGIAGANGRRHPVRLPALLPIRKPARNKLTVPDSVNIVSIVSAITCDGGNGTIHLIEQGADPGAIIDLRPGELGCEDLTRIGIHPDVYLAPGPTCPAAVFLDQPLPRPAEPQACAVHEQMHRLAPWP
jgi:hypothetical protein